MAICRERNIYLFSDEVYRLLERRPEMTLPQVADLYERGLSLGVMSKAYGLPGLRLGWIASKDVELLQPHGAREALHLDLQRGSQRTADPDRAEGP